MVKWNNSYNHYSSYSDYLFLEDDGYLAVNEDFENITVLKLDYDGNELWNMKIGSDVEFNAWSVLQEGDDIYIAGDAFVYIDRQNYINGFIVKMNHNCVPDWQLTEEWSECYPDGYAYMNYTDRNKCGLPLPEPYKSHCDYDKDGFAPDRDCDDNDGWMNPRISELCNDVDDDCDGEVDEDCMFTKDWSVRYGREGRDKIYGTYPTSDGGMIVAGNIEITLHEYYGWLYKIGPEGNIEWDKVYTQDNRSYISDVIEVPEGYVMLTESHSRSPSLIQAVDFDGDIIWSTQFDNLSNLVGIIPVDNGYVIGAFKNNGPGLGPDYALIKISKSGDIIWTKSYGNDYSQLIRSIDIDDDGFVLYGSREDCHECNPKPWIIKTDFDGNPIWNVTLSHVNTSERAAQIVTMDDGYVVSGYYQDGTSISWLTKIDKYGSEQWTRILDLRNGRFDDYFIDRTDDNGIIIAGSWVFTQLIKLDSEGNTEWNRSTRITMGYVAADVHSIGNSIYVAGRMLDFGGLNTFAFKLTQMCEPNWILSGWSDCVDNKQYKYYTDENECGLPEPEPLEQSCNIVKPRPPSHPPAGVPEFSFTTLLILVVTASLGIAIIRNR